MYNITTFENVLQYQTVKFNNAKLYLLLHQPNSIEINADGSGSSSVWEVRWEEKERTATMNVLDYLREDGRAQL